MLFGTVECDEIFTFIIKLHHVSHLLGNTGLGNLVDAENLLLDSLLGSLFILDVSVGNQTGVHFLERGF